MTRSGADLRPDPLDLLLDHGGRRPRRRRARDLVEEVLQDLLTRPACARPRGGTGRRRARAPGPRTRRSASTATRPSTRAPGGGAVTESRWLIQTTCSGGRSWKSADSSRFALGLAVLGDVVRLDGAAEVARHQLHPVTDAERRDAELERCRIEFGRPVGVDRGGAAGEDQRERVARRDLGRREPVADELRVDARLAHAAGDQLAVLAAEVEDEDRPLLRAAACPGERDDLRVAHPRR